jgi:hypothetical protein
MTASGPIFGPEGVTVFGRAIGQQYALFEDLYNSTVSRPDTSVDAKSLMPIGTKLLSWKEFVKDTGWSRCDLFGLD